jgi:hypothetical protein
VNSCGFVLLAFAAVLLHALTEMQRMNESHAQLSLILRTRTAKCSEARSHAAGHCAGMLSAPVTPDP